MKISLTRFGAIADEDLHFILQVLEETYRRVEPHSVVLVDLWLFARTASMEAHLTQEYAKAGVVSRRFDDRFFAIHDAWRGIPRITACIERMATLPVKVRAGSLQHEVGHSVLHGELRYYLLAQPRAFQEVQARYGLSPQFMSDLLYLTSVAVKDYEVTRCLVDHGCREEQTAYVESLLTATPEDVLAWRVAQNRPEAQALVLVAALKPLFGLAGLYASKEYKATAKSVVETYAYLPPRFRQRLLHVALTATLLSVGQTLENLERAAQAISSEIFDPLFKQ